MSHCTRINSSASSNCVRAGSAKHRFVGSVIRATRCDSQKQLNGPAVDSGDSGGLLDAKQNKMLKTENGLSVETSPSNTYYSRFSSCRDAEKLGRSSALEVNSSADRVSGQADRTCDSKDSLVTYCLDNVRIYVPGKRSSNLNNSCSKLGSESGVSLGREDSQSAYDNESPETESLLENSHPSVFMPLDPKKRNINGGPQRRIVPNAGGHPL